MTKKDYIGIAEVLKYHRASVGDNESYQNVINSLCDYFEKDNERFDRERFVNAIYQA